MVGDGHIRLSPGQRRVLRARKLITDCEVVYGDNRLALALGILEEGAPAEATNVAEEYSEELTEAEREKGAASISRTHTSWRLNWRG